MGLKKYEIITVGSDKRVRALRSWQVGDRYVNIGDVGGIVYDEKTLSQDGLCWLFRGNFGFPGARIGGDSIVDVAEATLSATGTPNVDILGSSVVVGSKLQFASDQTAADVLALGAADFEQGSYNYVQGIKWEDMRASSPNYVRTKSPIFAGGGAVTLKCEVPGYLLNWYALDRDGTTINASAAVTTGAGVTTTVTACQYFLVKLSKDPNAPIVPADAAAAKITFTGTYETKLSIIDSRVEINPANATGVATIIPGGTYAIRSGAKYPEAIIRNSRVSMNVPGATNRSFRLMGQIIGSTATLDATTNDIVIAGRYSNVKNLTVSGVTFTSLDVTAYGIIQVTDCNDFAVSPTVFPGRAAAQTANMPFIFQGCNVPNGKFYHHAKIANTYKNIDFALASVDLGKSIASGEVLASSEVEGMYRLYSVSGSVFGGLVEGYDSVKSLNMAGTASSYDTTIYKDAYLNGLFDIAGTNVFGNKVRSHPLAQVLNVAPRAVQGTFNAFSVGSKITGVVDNVASVCVPAPFRVNSSKGLTISTLPTGYEAFIILTDVNDVITNVLSVRVATDLPTNVLADMKVFIRFKKSDNSPITPEDLAGVTVTVYNGCKIVNTGETAVNMKGNIRVEGNATLTNCSIIGSGYFGGNCVASGLIVNGCAYMRDNASFTKTAGTTSIRNLKMTENAYAVVGDFSLSGRIHLSDNARFIPRSAELYEGDIIMKDNARVSENAAVIIGGMLVMKDNASVRARAALSAYGDITLCGSYNQTVNKSWTGKRTITDVNAPAYDNNVKTQYDF